MTIIELEPVDYWCQHCDSAMEWTACDAPRCTGYRCMGCGEGCDIYDEDGDGACSRALQNMPWALAHDRREERRIACRTGRPVRTVRLPGECL